MVIDIPKEYKHLIYFLCQSTLPPLISTKINSIDANDVQKTNVRSQLALNQMET